jgi:hypothetical protein
LENSEEGNSEEKEKVAAVRFELTHRAGSKPVEDSLDFPTPN